MAGLLAAACGDDSVEALPKDEYVAQANAICREANDAVGEAFEEFFATEFADLPDGPTTPEENQMVLDAMDEMFDDSITPVFDDQLADLRALGAPTGDADTLDDLYDDLESALDEFNSTLDDAAAGDEDAMEAIVSGSAETVFDDVNQEATDYGLTACGARDQE